MTVNLRSYKQLLRYRKTKFIRYLTRVSAKPPANLDSLAVIINKEVWKEVDCLTCANCCKTMTPTYNPGDIKRISAHFKLTANEFKKKWLHKDKAGDWLNKSTPCQFLDLKTNKCGIYKIRPDDCVGFPHITRKKMVEYIHVHKQNLDSCPATFKMVEKMMIHLDQKNGI